MQFISPLKQKSRHAAREHRVVSPRLVANRRMRLRQTREYRPSPRGHGSFNRRREDAGSNARLCTGAEICK